MARFIIKKSQNIRPSYTPKPIVAKKAEEGVEEIKDETKKKKKVMNQQEKIEAAQEILDNFGNEERPIKRVKKEKGLIERTESSKIILTEDNKQLLND